MGPKSAAKAEKKTVSKAKGAGDKPKRAASPYILFSTEKRPEVKAQNPDATFGELGKILGQMWSQMDDKAKAVSSCLVSIFKFYYSVSIAIRQAIQRSQGCIGELLSRRCRDQL